MNRVQEPEIEVGGDGAEVSIITIMATSSTTPYSLMDDDDASPLIEEIMQICNTSRQDLLEAIPRLPLDSSQGKEEEDKSSLRPSRFSSSDVSGSRTSDIDSLAPLQLHFTKTTVLVKNGIQKGYGVRRGRRSPQRSKPSMIWRSESLSSNSMSHSFCSAATESISNTKLGQKQLNARMETVLDDLRRQRDDGLTPGWDYSCVSSLGHHMGDDIKLAVSPMKGLKGILKSNVSVQSPQGLLEKLVTGNDLDLSISSPRGVDSPITPRGTHIRERVSRWSDHSDQSASPAKAPLRAKSPASKHHRKSHSRSPSRTRKRADGKSLSSSGRHGQAGQHRSRRSTSATSRRRQQSVPPKEDDKQVQRFLSPSNAMHHQEQSTNENRSVTGNKREQKQSADSSRIIVSRSLSPRQGRKQDRSNRVSSLRGDADVSPKKGRRLESSSTRMFSLSAVLPTESTNILTNEHEKRRHNMSRSHTPTSRTRSTTRERRRQSMSDKIEEGSTSARTATRSMTPSRRSRLLRKAESSDIPKPPLSPNKVSRRQASVRTLILPTKPSETQSRSSKPHPTSRQRLRLRSASPRSRSQIQTSGEKTIGENRSIKDRSDDIDWRNLSPRIHKAVFSKKESVKDLKKYFEQTNENGSVEKPSNGMERTLGLVRMWSRAQLQAKETGKVDNQKYHESCPTIVGCIKDSSVRSSTVQSTAPTLSSDSLDERTVTSSQTESGILLLQIFDF